MTELESLDLSSNMLVGHIPTQLTSLKYLSVLNLSYNQFEGPIPQGSQFNTFRNDSYVGNSGLCGFPLLESCNIDGAPEPVGSTRFGEEEDASSWFDWKFAKMGYGSGLVIGLSVGYMVFGTGKPRWLVRMIEKYQSNKVRITVSSLGIARRNYQIITLQEMGLGQLDLVYLAFGRHVGFGRFEEAEACDEPKNIHSL